MPGGIARDGDPNLFVGVPASPGLAVGRLVRVRSADIPVPESSASPREEQQRLDGARAQARLQLQALRARLVRDADPGKASIFAAHEALLDDPALLDIAAGAMALGRSAAFAWRQAVDTHARRLADLPDERVAARAHDVRDVGRRVLGLLTGTPASPRAFPERTVLVAEDLSPSDVATLDPACVRGFCTAGGGVTSHVAILARSLEIPAVVGIDPRALRLPDGALVALDGTRGTLRLGPSPDEVAGLEERLARRRARRQEAIEAAGEPAVTRNGRRLAILANVSDAAEAGQVRSRGGEGIGLLRSEFLFLDRATPPAEDEQFEVYAEVARALGPGQPLVVRTLDVGGDKPLAYLRMPQEANPFLGQRGIRLQLGRPGLLRGQLRAILRTGQVGCVRVMFPMVATMAEWRTVRAVLDEERARLAVPPIPAGIMVEVPAAALLAEQFAAEVDFFSIGTNDLAQYTLAMDRGHPGLAPQIDGLDPSVLHLVARTVAAAERHGKRVAVCGDLASDPQAVPVLVGLGVHELSVSVPAIPAVKAQVRALDDAWCRSVAGRALACGLATEVRALVPGPEDD